MGFIHVPIGKLKLELAEPWWLRRERICLQSRRPGFNPWVGKIPWRRAWQPTPVFLPARFCGQRSLAGYSPWGRKQLDTTERLCMWGTEVGFDGKKNFFNGNKANNYQQYNKGETWLMKWLKIICSVPRSYQTQGNRWGSGLMVNLSVHSSVPQAPTPLAAQPGALLSPSVAQATLSLPVSALSWLKFLPHTAASLVSLEFTSPLHLYHDTGIMWTWLPSFPPTHALGPDCTLMLGSVYCLSHPVFLSGQANCHGYIPVESVSHSVVSDSLPPHQL